MYIPTTQTILAAGLAITGLTPNDDSVAKGSVMDYAVKSCLDDEGNVRCTKPFLVKKGACYNIEWSTDGALSHTTVEARDAASGEMVYYRDTNGQWEPEKGELVYLDFNPKVWKTGNDTVDYEVTKCEKESDK